MGQIQNLQNHIGELQSSLEKKNTELKSLREYVTKLIQERDTARKELQAEQKKLQAEHKEK